MLSPSDDAHVCTSRQCHGLLKDEFLQQDMNEYGPYLAHVWFGVKMLKRLGFP